MNYYDEPRDMSIAINGRMMIRICSIVSILTAVMEMLVQGMTFINVSRGAKMGEEQAKQLLVESGFTAGQINLLGVVCVAAAIVIILCSVICLKLSNRLDTVRPLMVAGVVLAVATLGQKLFMMVGYRFVTPMGMIASVIIPGIMLWSISRYMMLAKKYPDKIYAVMTKKLQQEMAVSGHKDIMSRATRKVQD